MSRRPQRQAPRREVRWVLRFALVACWVAAAVITHLPGPGVSDDPATQKAVRGIWVSVGESLRFAGDWIPDAWVDLARPRISDKTVHFGMSLSLAFLWASSRAVDRGLTRRRAALIVVVLSAYAAISEIAQSLMGRYGDPGDLLANVAGALVGSGAVYAAQAFVRRRALACAPDPSSAAPPAPQGAHDL